MFRCNTPANFERVSLFTREWIEISIPTTQNQQENVSLFTREWIEI